MSARKDCKYFNACGSSDNCKRCEGYEAKKCCICGNKFTEYGNNPWPVKEDGTCCDTCNSRYVLAARLEMMYRKEEK